MKRILVLCITVTIALVLQTAPVNAMPAGGAPSAPAGISGKVVETMDSGGYTYVLLENKGKKTWVAAPQMKVTKGKTMTFRPGMEMKNFESKTLKRKFDSIIFSDGAVQ